MSNAMASVVGAFANRKFSINRNTGVPRERRFSLGEPNATGEFGRSWLSRLGCLGHSTHNACKPPVPPPYSSFKLSFIKSGHHFADHVLL